MLTEDIDREEAEKEWTTFTPRELRALERRQRVRLDYSDSSRAFAHNGKPVPFDQVNERQSLYLLRTSQGPCQLRYADRRFKRDIKVPGRVAQIEGSRVLSVVAMALGARVMSHSWPLPNSSDDNASKRRSKRKKPRAQRRMGNNRISLKSRRRTAH